MFLDSSLEGGVNSKEYLANSQKDSLEQIFNGRVSGKYGKGSKTFTFEDGSTQEIASYKGRAKAIQKLTGLDSLDEVTNLYEQVQNSNDLSNYEGREKAQKKDKVFNQITKNKGLEGVLFDSVEEESQEILEGNDKKVGMAGKLIIYSLASLITFGSLFGCGPKDKSYDQAFLVQSVKVEIQAPEIEKPQLPQSVSDESDSKEIEYSMPIPDFDEVDLKFSELVDKYSKIKIDLSEDPSQKKLALYKGLEAELLKDGFTKREVGLIYLSVLRYSQDYKLGNLVLDDLRKVFEISGSAAEAIIYDSAWDYVLNNLETVGSENNLNEFKNFEDVKNYTDNLEKTAQKGTILWYESKNYLEDLDIEASNTNIIYVMNALKELNPHVKDWTKLQIGTKISFKGLLDFLRVADLIYDRWRV